MSIWKKPFVKSPACWKWSNNNPWWELWPGWRCYQLLPPTLSTWRGNGCPMGDSASPVIRRVQGKDKEHQDLLGQENWQWLQSPLQYHQQRSSGPWGRNVAERVDIASGQFRDLQLQYEGQWLIDTEETEYEEEETALRKGFRCWNMGTCSG